MICLMACGTALRMKLTVAGWGVSGPAVLIAVVRLCIRSGVCATDYNSWFGKASYSVCHILWECEGQGPLRRGRCCSRYLLTRLMRCLLRSPDRHHLRPMCFRLRLHCKYRRRLPLVSHHHPTSRSRSRSRSLAGWLLRQPALSLSWSLTVTECIVCVIAALLLDLTHIVVLFGIE